MTVKKPDSPWLTLAGLAVIGVIIIAAILLWVEAAAMLVEWME